MNSPLRSLFLVMLLVCGCSFPKAVPTEEVPPESLAPVAQKTKELDYLVALTGDVSAEAAAPMLVLIHGYGGTPEKMLKSFENLPGPARVVSLRGDPTPRRGFVWFPVRVQDPDIERLASGLTHAGARIAKQLEVLVERYPTLGRPVIAGFSQGGMLAVELGLKHPERVGASIVLSGYYPPLSYPTEGPGEWSPPFFSVHGTADPVLPIAAMREAIAAIEGRGYNVKHWEYEGMEHGLSAAAHGQAMGVMSQQLAVQSAL
jgi:phospholipase/carboxylesterase